MGRREGSTSGGSLSTKVVVGALTVLAGAAAVVVVMSALAPGGAAREAERLLDRRGDAAIDAPVVARALWATPVNAALVRALGLATSQAGDEKRADALMVLAGDLSWRDNAAQSWLLNRRLQEERYDEAMRHADALLRREADLRRIIYPSLIAVADRPAAADALVGRLALNPTWRTPFIETLSSVADPETTFGILQRLSRTKSPPTSKEASAYVNRLAALQRYDAVAPALALLSPGTGGGARLQNGNFDEAEGISVYTWRLFEGVGSSVVFDRAPGDRPGKALYVYYDGYSSVRLAEQQLLLSPGRYRLKVEQISAAEGQAFMQWTVRCIDSGAALLTVSRPQETEWRSLSGEFVVPAEGCKAQLLQLEPIPGDLRTTVETWYDNMAIDRMATQ